MILLKKRWSEMTINQKINWRGEKAARLLEAGYSFSSSKKENQLARGQVMGSLFFEWYYVPLKEQVFCDSINAIAEKIEEGFSPLFFERRGEDFIQVPSLSNIADHDVWFAMVLIDELWCFAPKFIKAEERDLFCKNAEEKFSV